MQLRQRLFVIGFNAYTALLWGWYVIAFLSKGETDVPRMLADVYVIVLTFYASDKEIRRWRRQHFSTRRVGELIVGGWIATLSVIAVFEFAGGSVRGYRIPEGLEVVVGIVLAVFLITEYLKTEFHRKHRR